MDDLTTRPARVLRMRRLMLRLLPLALLLLLVAGRVGLLEWHHRDGLEAFDGSDFATAVGEFDANRSVNPFQPWVAAFNEGVAHHRDGDVQRAIDDYESALASVPLRRECTVRVNLALAHEASGDAFAQAGNTASARTEWQAGREVLAAGLCRTEAGQGPEEQERAATVDQRLADKLADRDSPTSSPSTSPTPSPTPSSGAQEPSRQQLEELDRLNREGAHTRRDNDELDGGTGDGGFHW